MGSKVVPQLIRRFCQEHRDGATAVNRNKAEAPLLKADFLKVMRGIRKGGVAGPDQEAPVLDQERGLPHPAYGPQQSLTIAQEIGCIQGSTVRLQKETALQRKRWRARRLGWQPLGSDTGWSCPVQGPGSARLGGRVWRATHRSGPAVCTRQPDLRPGRRLTQPLGARLVRICKDIVQDQGNADQNQTDCKIKHPTTIIPSFARRLNPFSGGPAEGPAHS